jgi:hypothetical protein
MQESGTIGGTDILGSVTAKLGSAKLEYGDIGVALSSTSASQNGNVESCAKSDSAMIDPNAESAKMESS